MPGNPIENSLFPVDDTPRIDIVDVSAMNSEDEQFGFPVCANSVGNSIFCFRLLKAESIVLL